MVTATDVAFTNASGGRGLRAENPKPSHNGLIPGLPSQSAMVGSAGYWWCTSLKVVAVAGIAFANTSGEKGFGAENPKLSPCARFWAASGQMLLEWVAV